MKSIFWVFIGMIPLLALTACGPSSAVEQDTHSEGDSFFASLLEGGLSEDSPFAELAGIISPRRERVLSRAREWIIAEEETDKEVPVPYSRVPQPDWENYRADCSGFVSYAWELGAPGKTTSTLPNVATQIEVGDLQPGDILLYQPPGSLIDGHVVLFVKWEDQEGGVFTAFEQNGFFGHAKERPLTLERRGGGWYISEEKDENGHGEGPYIPMAIIDQGEVKGASDVQETIQPTELPYEIMDQKVSSVDGKIMMFVPAGEFLMGENAKVGFDSCKEYNDPSGFFEDECQLEDYRDEEPIHKVYLDAFWIDQTEVTNREYKRCMEAGICKGSPAEYPYWRGDVPCDIEGLDCEWEQYFSNPDYADYPVVGITWNEAEEYCNWAGKRLPTEAEWEKAAKGTERRSFPWGDSFADYWANFCGRRCFSPQFNENFEDGYGDYSPVGSFPEGASPYGVLDMAGNASEWTADWYGKGYYQTSPYDNPQGPDNGEFRVQRGGSAHSSINELRTTRRLTQWDYGFRCVQTAE